MKKVIIPEDLKAILEGEKSLFSRSDIRIFPVATNRKALSLHRAKKADLVVAKLDTPDMSGEMLCALIREDDKLRNVSIIIICSGTERDLDRCTQCSANAFVTKPVDMAVLAEEAHQLLHIAPRAAYRVPISIEFEGISNRTPFIGFIENISASGILLRSAADLFEGDTVTCSFVLPGSRRITIGAEIIRILPKQRKRDIAGYGARFTDLGASTFSAIKAFIGKKGRAECGHRQTEGIDVREGLRSKSRG